MGSSVGDPTVLFLPLACVAALPACDEGCMAPGAMRGRLLLADAFKDRLRVPAQVRCLFAN